MSLFFWAITGTEKMHKISSRAPNKTFRQSATTLYKTLGYAIGSVVDL